MTITHMVEVESRNGVDHGRIAYDEACGMYIGIIGEKPATDYSPVPIDAIGQLADILSEHAPYCQISVRDV